VHSYPHSEAHRVIICLAFEEVSMETANFVIYKTVGVYSDEYKQLLQPYFIAY